MSVSVRVYLVRGKQEEMEEGVLNKDSSQPTGENATWGGVSELLLFIYFVVQRLLLITFLFFICF